MTCSIASRFVVASATFSSSRIRNFVSLKMSFDNESELNEFFKSPDFSVSTISCDCDEPSDFQNDWNKCMDVATFSKVTFLSSNTSSLKYHFVKERYLGLTKMRKNYTVTFPFFYLALAETHFLLSDIHGCLAVLDEISRIVNLTDHNDLIQLKNRVTKLLDQQTILDNKYHDQPDIKILYMYSAPSECPEIRCKSFDTLLMKGNSLKNKEKDALVQFQRYACVSSNELEGVFSVEGQSWPRLIRKGFFINSIDGISQLSKQKKKRVIIKILENTMESLKLLSQCLDDYNLFTEEFIKKIHFTMLQNDNFVEEQMENCEGEMFSMFILIPNGRYRQVACIADHQEGSKVTQFCKHSDISEQMERYCRLARILLNNSSIDVFVKVAWLQWAFLRIHPFADGNGRVARIISSLPLCKLHLPPVAVSQAKKKSYFQCLHVADRENNLSPLASFLRESIEMAITEISEMGNDVLENSVSCGFGKTRTRKGDEFIKYSEVKT